MKLTMLLKGFEGPLRGSEGVYGEGRERSKGKGEGGRDRGTCTQRQNEKSVLDTKFGVSDYVGDITPHAKIQNNRPSGGVPAHG